MSWKRIHQLLLIKALLKLNTDLNLMRQVFLSTGTGTEPEAKIVNSAPIDSAKKLKMIRCIAVL
ncbi:MAG: hypothetical protein D8M58_13400 [Calditrichaeota bacterium]|nr:MAG: hypothetical protein DWQ03_00365 [Calditrichota bacterium]MBL1206394.1 hypothetical protein [Calditrichota bacterium]NOG46220.1 hypothetical protein [Calditrichota bacterium]